MEVKQCFCIGPQNGEPLCPCRMRHIQVKDGRYVETIDHGPVKPRDSREWFRWRDAVDDMDIKGF